MPVNLHLKGSESHGNAKKLCNKIDRQPLLDAVFFTDLVLVCVHIELAERTGGNKAVRSPCNSILKDPGHKKQRCSASFTDAEAPQQSVL